MCEVHHIAMKSVVVPGWGGCKLPTTTYAETRQKLFPHTYPFQVDSPWPWKRQRIYLCGECVAAEKKWDFGATRGQQPASGNSRYPVSLKEPGRFAAPGLRRSAVSCGCAWPLSLGCTITSYEKINEHDRNEAL